MACPSTEARSTCACFRWWEASGCPTTTFIRHNDRTGLVGNRRPEVAHPGVDPGPALGLDPRVGVGFRKRPAPAKAGGHFSNNLKRGDDSKRSSRFRFVLGKKRAMDLA